MRPLDRERYLAIVLALLAIGRLAVLARRAVHSNNEGGRVPEPVRWRHDGHQLPAPDATTSTRMLLLRFDSRVFDPDQIITMSAGTAAEYADICRAQGLPDGEFVLPLSCFAITKHWTPQRLAEGTRYEQYRAADPSVLRSRGFELWPTAVFGEDGEPDPRNEVHFDLVLDRIHLVDLEEIILRRPGRHGLGVP